MFNFLRFIIPSADLVISKLFDEKTFYQSFMKDLEKCKKEVIIESPYITSSRARAFFPVFINLLDKGVKITVITRDPKEHDFKMAIQAEEIIRIFESIDVQVLLCAGNHHRKLAIIDRKILWEGSLNILSQRYSREIMRRIASPRQAIEMFQFLKLGKFIY